VAAEASVLRRGRDLQAEYPAGPRITLQNWAWKRRSSCCRRAGIYGWR